MPVSGNEETGVKCVTRRSSLDISGVPIKKRRFFRPPSPPPEEQTEEKSLVPSANASPRNEDRKPLEDLACSNVSVAECSFNANKNSECEENKESSGNVVQTERNDFPRVKIEESSSDHASDSLAKLGDVEKLQTAVESSDANAGLAANNISAPNTGKEIKGPEIGDGKVTLDIPMVSENASSLLGPKEHNVSALEAHNTGGSSENQQNVEPVSLNLSLSMGEQDNKGKSEDLQTNAVGCSEQANRSNWDLNTTMDAWAGTSSDMAADRKTADALNTVSDPVNVKPLLGGAGSNGGKQLVEEGPRSGFIRTFSEPRFNAGDSLNLGLSPFLSLNSGEGTSGSIAAKNLNSVSPNDMPTGVAAGNVMVVNSTTVKSEPLDASLKHDFGKSLPSSTSLPKAIKVELTEKSFQESQGLPSSCASKLDSISIKAEPFLEGNQQALKNGEGASVQSYNSVLQGQGTEGKSVSPSEKQVLHAQGAINEFSCSKDHLKNIAMTSTSSKDKLSVNGNELEHTEDAKPDEGGNPIKEVPNDSETSGQVALTMDSQVLVHHSNESSIPAMTDNTNSEKNVDNLECHRKVIVKDVLDSHGIGEGPVCDDEKTNLCGDILEEDGYECESDGNSMPMDIEEDNRLRNYEDGEVHEQQLGSAGVNPEKGEDTGVFDSVNENRKFSQLSDDENKDVPIFKEEDTREDTVETGKDSAKEFNDTHLHEKTVEDAGKHISMQESMVIEIRNRGANENEEIKEQPVHNLGNLDATKGECTEQASDQVIGVGQQRVETSSPGSVGNMIRNNEGMNDDSALLKAETSLNVDDTSKDANAGGNRSRIINLSRPLNASSPSKPLSSRSGRERLPDSPLERDHLHSRGRDEIHDDVAWKFSRERYQDHPYRNSRLNFGRGRGRVSNRIVSFRGDRNSERDYNSDYRNSLSEYGIPRNKYVLAEAEAEFGNYNVGPDGTFTGAARPGRKMMDGDSSVFRHPPSRKRSPGWRDGPTGRGLQMVRRTPRNIGEEGCEGVGLRHGEKFMREFSDDGQDHTFTRSQTSYKGLDNHYVQGSRSLLSAQRRPRSYVRSKSPIRSRSPGPWSSKRRSPDVFGGHLELPHRRSPIYMERMRSPDHSVFPGEMLVRRHGSPQYLTRANDLSNMDIGRDPGHLRSAISNRSPNGRVFFRNPRRFGIVDPRERPDEGGLFGGDVHSGRFNELDENSEDRRRISDRRVPMHSFRPPFSGTDSENFHLNAEHRPRPFRFHVNTEDPQFRESGSLRDREYDRRNKDRPGNVPRRPRGIEG